MGTKAGRNGDERRHFTRFPFKVHATLSDDDNSWETELLDISIKGALIVRPANWKQAVEKAGGRLQIQLEGSETTIDMEVLITYIESERMGLRCEHIGMESFEHLKRLVELNLGDETLLQRELSALL